MKKHSCWIGLLTLLSAIGWIATGCDTQSSTAKVSIEPSSVRMATGQSQEFVASGGYDYTWDLQDESLGILSSRSGNRVTYTALGVGAVQVITVTSTIEGASTGTTNSPDYQMSAEAFVYGSTETNTTDGGTDTNQDALAVSPTSVSMGINSVTVLTASGGSGSYSWSVEDTSLGSISASTGGNIAYSSGGDIGTNSVSCADTVSSAIVNVPIVQTDQQ